ncbi:MAG: glutathionylspermidine synthase family protein [Tissierellia bacterium]|nr:glutathionylspermidine synthase family protein [Tissierellia bacterium]
MFNRELVENYLKIIKSNPEDYFEDYKIMQDRVNNSSAIYKNKPIPVTYQGMFFGRENIEEFKEISKTLMEITRKVTNEYLNNPEYRTHFKYSKKLEELILHDPGYDIPVPICRYDVFYNGIGDYKFCEFNTDGSSAMNEEMVLGSIMRESKAFKEFEREYEIKRFELFDSWVKKSIEIYRESKRANDKPNIAIVDFIDKGTTNEFIRFKEAYNEAGYNCEIVDPREIEYKNGKLMHREYRIDMVYRRAVTMDIMENIDEIEQFINAYMEDAFVMIGSFRSQIMHTKLIFKILRLEATQKILSDRENEFLKAHIPNTEEFITEEDFEKVLNDKDSYILKPYDGYASYKVYAGREYSKDEWEKVLKDLLGQNYIYQDYFDMEKVDFIEFEEDGSYSITPYASVIGMFIYKEEFQGLYTRIGNQALISGARRYYTAPNYVIQNKNK